MGRHRAASKSVEDELPDREKSREVIDSQVSPLNRGSMNARPVVAFWSEKTQMCRSVVLSQTCCNVSDDFKDEKWSIVR